MSFKFYIENNLDYIKVFRGTGPEGLKKMRPSEEGIYGPGIYFYDNLRSASVYSERGGGVICGHVPRNEVQIVPTSSSLIGLPDEYSRKERIIILQNPSFFKLEKIIPWDET